MLILLLAGTATALATGLGAVPVFLLGDRAEALRPVLWGLAAGVMAVASVVGLLLPALDEGSPGEVAAGVAAGVLFLVVSRALVQRSKMAHDPHRGAGMRASVLVFGVLFVHSLPEGFAIGTAYASDTEGLALFVILAIGLQNIPEGTSVAIPMAEAAGPQPPASSGPRLLTSAPQPVGAVLAFLLVEEMRGAAAVSFAFAAGAMLALVVLRARARRPRRREMARRRGGVRRRLRRDARDQRGAQRLRSTSVVRVTDQSQISKPRVVIAGGGIAGIEALLALRDLAADRVEVTLVAAEPEFVYKPLIVEEPFGPQPAERHELAPAVTELGGRFVLGVAKSVRSDAGTIAITEGGEGQLTSELEYDLLVMCIGGHARAAYKNAATFRFRSIDDPLEVDDLLARAQDHDSKTLAFVVPPGVTWTLPLYELALLTRRRAEEGGMADTRITLITPEEEPLVLFGRPGERCRRRVSSGGAGSSSTAPPPSARRRTVRWC